MHFPRDKHVCLGNFCVHVCVFVCVCVRERKRESGGGGGKEVSFSVIVSTCAGAAVPPKTVLGRLTADFVCEFLRR